MNSLAANGRATTGLCGRWLGDMARGPDLTQRAQRKRPRLRVWIRRRRLVRKGWLWPGWQLGVLSFFCQADKSFGAYGERIRQLRPSQALHPFYLKSQLRAAMADLATSINYLVVWSNTTFLRSPRCGTSGSEGFIDFTSRTKIVGHVISRAGFVRMKEGFLARQEKFRRRELC
jgi:hypothetical protein